MQKNRKTPLALFIGALLLPTTTFATTSETASQSSTFDMLAAQPLFADSKVDITFRNFWKYLKTDDGPTTQKTIAQAWGQAIALDFKSGYFADFIGFDVSYYGGVKLAASENFSSRAILYNNNGHAEGYNKIGQRYVKLKFDFDPVRFDAKAGWQVMRNIGILTSSTRMSINSYMGWYGKFTFDNFYAEIAKVTSTSRRDSPHKVQFKTAGGKKIDNIIMGGITYKDSASYLSLFYGDAKDYIKQYGLEATYKATPKLTLKSQIYAQYADNKDDMMKISLSKRPFDNKAWHYAGSMQWKEPKWNTELGMGYTKAKKEDGLGFYSRNIVSNSRGRFNSLAYADIDYTRDGEFYLSAKYEYNLTSDYSVGISSMYGHLKYKGNTMNANSVTLFNYWQPKELKNLSIYASVGYGWHYKNNNRTPYLDDNNHVMRSHSLSGSMTLVYKL